jgi:hypothetical protein
MRRHVDCAVLVSLLTGRCCAEDRHTGTLPWRAAVAGFGLVKAGVAMAMALCCAWLPLLILTPGGCDFWPGVSVLRPTRIRPSPAMCWRSAP